MLANTTSWVPPPGKDDQKYEKKGRNTRPEHTAFGVCPHPLLWYPICLPERRFPQTSGQHGHSAIAGKQKERPKIMERDLQVASQLRSRYVSSLQSRPYDTSRTVYTGTGYTFAFSPQNKGLMKTSGLFLHKEPDACCNPLKYKPASHLNHRRQTRYYACFYFSISKTNDYFQVRIIFAWVYPHNLTSRLHHGFPR